MSGLYKDTFKRGTSIELKTVSPLTLPNFLSFLHIQLALFSVGPAHRSDLNFPKTIDALQGYPLPRTDRNGWIELSTDGEQMWVEVERQ